MGQVTARVSDDLEAALNRWAADDGQQRSDLIRQILTEAADARREGRATFDRPELPTPADLQHLTAEVRIVLVELNRVLRQNAKRDAELVGHAKADTLGVSDARAAIVSQLTGEIGAARDAVLASLGKLPDAQVAALAASPGVKTMGATLARIEKHPCFDEILAGQEAHAVALRENTAVTVQAAEQPKTHVSYTVWDKEWSGRRVLAGLAVIWAFCVASYFALAMVLPVSWLAVPSANRLLGGGDRAICALVNYRFATDSCRTMFEGKPGKVTVKATPGGTERAR